MSELVLGIDVGTQGARAVVADRSGKVIAQASEGFAPKSVELPQGYSEQHPDQWWEAVSACLRRITREIDYGISAIAVDSTSGTIVAVDSDGRPLRPAIMYNDSRSVAESEIVNRLGLEHTRKLGYLFNASFGLPKVFWIRENEPEFFRAARFIHAADYIVGRITGDFSQTDSSNALKTGYDSADSRWPDFILDEIGSDRLPDVREPGELLNTVSRSCDEETGLRAGTPVMAGVSDGTAGFVASGAAALGDWNSTLGTTLVMRGISEKLLLDPRGRFYCHRHPDGWWLPGGASNVGCESLDRTFPDEDLDSLALEAEKLLPTGLLVYPLVRSGERLPFVDSNAQGFVKGDAAGRAQLFGAYLEGIAFVERWILETAGSLGADTSGSIFTTGGGAKSSVWMKIRASVLNRRVCRPEVSDCAVGSAIVAASRTLYRNLTEAGQAMVKLDLAVETAPDLVAAYDSLYSRFRAECLSRFGF
jgi:D-ribulokinase